MSAELRRMLQMRRQRRRVHKNDLEGGGGALGVIILGGIQSAGVHLLPLVVPSAPALPFHRDIGLRIGVISTSDFLVLLLIRRLGLFRVSSRMYPSPFYRGCRERGLVWEPALR